MLSIFARKQYQQLIKYHNENVINIDTTESDDNDESEEQSSSD